MTHEQLIAECTQWFWNEFPEERRCLFAINNNVSAGLSKHQQMIEGNKNKAKGVVPGIFDLCYILPQKVIYMDGKIGKDVLSDEQKDFKAKAESRGCGCEVFSTLMQFQVLIRTLQDIFMI